MAYQVLHMKASPTMSSHEADENQRNWTKEQLHRHNQDPRNFYDPTRQNLNFEIDSRGEVQPINTSPSIVERMEARCKALGSKPPKKDAKQPRKRVMKFIVSGDTELMRRLAFGEQEVDYTWDENKTANLGLRREKTIELWAKDVYDFMCRKFGKENIVGFDCHCDEGAPHLHVAIVPVGRNGKVSFAGVVGDDKDSLSAFMKNLHTQLADEVSSKWGMVRGEDTSGRDVHHRDKPEYYAQLSRDIRKAEIRLASLQTMVKNLEGRLEAARNELAGINEDIAAGNGDKAELEKKQLELYDLVSELEAKLADKQEKLRVANQQLADLKEKTQSNEVMLETAERTLSGIIAELQNDSGAYVSSAMFDAIYPSLRQLFDNPEKMKEFLGGHTILEGIDHKAFLEIRHDAIQAFLIGITGGEVVSVGTGGGGSTSDLKWRDDNPDETHAAFMHRCLNRSIKSYKAANAPKRTR